MMDLFLLHFQLAKGTLIFWLSQIVNFVCELPEFGWQTVNSGVAFAVCLRSQYLKISILNSRRAGARNPDYLLNPHFRNTNFQLLAGWGRKLRFVLLNLSF